MGLALTALMVNDYTSSQTPSTPMEHNYVAHHATCDVEVEEATDWEDDDEVQFGPSITKSTDLGPETLRRGCDDGTAIPSKHRQVENLNDDGAGQQQREKSHFRPSALGTWRCSVSSHRVGLEDDGSVVVGSSGVNGPEAFGIDDDDLRLMRLMDIPDRSLRLKALRQYLVGAEEEAEALRQSRRDEGPPNAEGPARHKWRNERGANQTTTGTTTEDEQREVRSEVRQATQSMNGTTTPQRIMTSGHLDVSRRVDSPQPTVQQRELFTRSSNREKTTVGQQEDSSRVNSPTTGPQHGVANFISSQIRWSREAPDQHRTSSASIESSLNRVSDANRVTLGDRQSSREELSDVERYTSSISEARRRVMMQPVNGRQTPSTDTDAVSYTHLTLPTIYSV